VRLQSGQLLELGGQIDTARGEPSAHRFNVLSDVSRIQHAVGRIGASPSSSRRPPLSKSLYEDVDGAAGFASGFDSVLESLFDSLLVSLLDAELSLLLDDELPSDFDSDFPARA
jgi:hypothetical protein